LAQLIGADSFEPLARHFWQQHPPARGDMGQWGAQLPEFLEAAPQLAGEPFLGDVARLEWALHCAASAPDAVLDMPSFALLGDDAAQPVGLALSEGTATLASAWPVVSIVNAHLTGQPALDVAADLLRQGLGECALVWRQGFKPMLRALTEAEYAFVKALGEGAALEDALERASRQASSVEATFDFNMWLGQAAQTGLITRAVQI
jgi:Putative DNA-binding domain